MLDMEKLIGKKLEEAVTDIKGNGLTPRIVREDNKNHIITMDLRMDRVNLEVDKGIVTYYKIG